eukprot:m.135783 g.135783  ORF g.135783 m.135783 type:complete len:65 (+) comp13913_c0_seq2:2324-2518(+)
MRRQQAFDNRIKAGSAGSGTTEGCGWPVTATCKTLSPCSHKTTLTAFDMTLQQLGIPLQTRSAP